MNGSLELAVTTSGNSFSTTAATVTNLTQYDDWCLGCHGRTTVTLGGIAPDNARGTLLAPAAFAGGRHRNQVTVGKRVGCIFCHQPHGRSNAKLVRENAANRANGGLVPARFGVFPSDNTGSYTGTYFNASVNENVLYRARNYWENAAMPYTADADEGNNFCNRACHDPSSPKDRMVVRDNTTGNYVLSGNRKQYLVDGFVYPAESWDPSWHVHVNDDIIPTDNMVQFYAAAAGISGPAKYQYPPATGSALPSAYSWSVNFPFAPDYLDSLRDYTNAYNGLGQRIRYRFVCNTCHDPHGTTLPNSTGTDDGFPDLRLRKANPSTLCQQCHR
jgi:hypothetical protein